MVHFVNDIPDSHSRDDLGNFHLERAYYIYAVKVQVVNGPLIRLSTLDDPIAHYPANTSKFRAEPLLLTRMHPTNTGS